MLVGVSKQSVQDRWKAFHPKMECPLFYTTTFINDTAAATTLVDDGSQSYAQISELLAKKLFPVPLDDLKPWEGLNNKTARVHHVGFFESCFS